MKMPTVCTLMLTISAKKLLRARERCVEKAESTNLRQRYASIRLRVRGENRAANRLLSCGRTYYCYKSPCGVGSLAVPIVTNHLVKRGLSGSN